MLEVGWVDALNARDRRWAGVVQTWRVDLMW
jgi:hypothetical protein